MPASKARGAAPSAPDVAALPYRPCVGIVLVNRDGLVFAAQRLDHVSDAWQMPQGGIDAGEEPRDAALRELREETGITPDLVTIEAEAPDVVTYDLPAELLGKLWRGRYRGQAQRWFLLRFHGSDAQIDIATPEPEFSAWDWLPPDDLPRRIVPFKRAVYETVLTAFAPHLSRWTRDAAPQR